MSDETPFQDPFELLKKMWAPMGIPMGFPAGVPSGLPMSGVLAPLLDPSEIEKRIADLKSVENWLNMNLNVLRMTIQGLEMQKATLAAFQAMQPRADPTAKSPPPWQTTVAATPPAADAWWTLLQQMQNPASVPEPQPGSKPEKKGK